MPKRNAIVRFGLVLGAALLAGSIAHAFGETGQTAPQPGVPNAQEELAFFQSNRYTSPEPPAQYVPVIPVGKDFKLVGDNGSLALYMNMETYAIQIKNKATGYVWSSVPDERAMAKEELNDDWKNVMLSPFILEYFDAEDEALATSNYRSLQGKAVAAKPIPNGMEVTYALADLGIRLTVRTALDDQGLSVTLPGDGIEEQGNGRLASIQLYPFLGAVRRADVPGYLFIPDGSGALIRFTDHQTRFDEPYVGQIYGHDMTTTGFGWSNRVSYPVFGIVHGAERNALMGTVEQGQTNAEIVAYPSGVNTNFYWISPRFEIRYAYFQPTSQSMGGINAFTKQRTEGDKQVRYAFLSGKKADYAGMAAAYRASLQARGMLPEASGAAGDGADAGDVPVQIDFLGGDIEPGILSKHVVKLTSFADAQAILEDLQRQGVRRVTAVLKGWNAGGLNGVRPAKPAYAGELGGRSGFEALRNYAQQRQIALHLYTNYTDLLGGSPRTSVRSDAARMVTDRLAEYSYVSKFVNALYKDMKGYLLRPATALRLATDDFASLREDGLTHLTLDGTGFILFSDYGGKQPVNRTEAVGAYGRLADEAAKRSLGLAINEPNDYMLKHAESILNVPMESSQFMYTTDTVPFVQMALHGVVDYYEGYANHQADPSESMLRMIEYGAYPSFILTKEPSWKLQNTPSSELFSTAYEDWAPEIKRLYDKANEALKPVRNAYMIARAVPDYGIVQVRYDNGVDIWINYTGQEYSDGTVRVPARDFAVTGGDRS
ncbi:DUF5696 domain-containing protein [Cohnella nanjingensis]|uniref:Uncharacterized protein n=1 Tax=Cohnella nanjingensis TaxID=1387779 RepID=A0A7X0VGC3_9BACL|nr:DUF5696 domain-containing protein [Cohnella nanjingensis]MBB6672173.1 hypothetical protein [Cohnella nanjingensis]